MTHPPLCWTGANGLPTGMFFCCSPLSTVASVKVQPRDPPLEAVWVSIELDLASVANDAPAFASPTYARASRTRNERPSATNSVSSRGSSASLGVDDSSSSRESERSRSLSPRFE